MLLAVLFFRSFNGSSEPGTPLTSQFNPVEAVAPPYSRNFIIARFAQLSDSSLVQRQMSLKEGVADAVD